MDPLLEEEPPSVDDVLSPVAGAAQRARDLITQACLRWKMPHLLAPAALVVTELVTNAVQHARTMVDLHLVRGRRYLLILACDGSSTVPATPRAAADDTPELLTERGRGLMIVEATAAGWGARQIPGGKLVWAALR